MTNVPAKLMLFCSLCVLASFSDSLSAAEKQVDYPKQIAIDHCFLYFIAVKVGHEVKSDPRERSQNSPMNSPPPGVSSFFKIAGSMFSETKRTLPSSSNT